ncbi:hypothetical protein OS493_040635 [Desmophyllum pertusum]|uniref:Olfactomedin-like domain-containing protein n=1 Tax=Desmophyllum pertusum TaxID=174260 RepID=A0A9W9YTK1_9CNID|nr:hypothetical protein OS493_040635 [Desmophyllum pertusum]
MDLAVDEQGLWVLFGSTSNNKRLSASKLDVDKNSITQTWNLNTEKMNTMGNAFVACGVIYCINSYSKRSTTINFAYDTKTGKTMEPQHTVHKPVRLQHYGGLQSQRKSAVRLG